MSSLSSFVMSRLTLSSKFGIQKTDILFCPSSQIGHRGALFCKAWHELKTFRGSLSGNSKKKSDFFAFSWIFSLFSQENLVFYLTFRFKCGIIKGYKVARGRHAARANALNFIINTMSKFRTPVSILA